MSKSRAKKKSQAKKRSQAKKKSQSKEVPVKEETTTKEEVPTSEEIPVNGKDPAKGQSPAKDETPATEDRWTKYLIETEFIAKMKPLSSPVIRDLEHEVLCDFNVDDALPLGKYMPEIACSQGERPRYSHPTKLPFQLDPLDMAPRFGFGWMFNAMLRSIKTVNPDFRFDNIDIIAHASTLGACSIWFDNNTPANAEQLGFVRFQLWGNVLFIYNHEEIRFGRIGSLPYAVLSAITSKDWRRPHRAVRYNFGGLKCIVLFPYDVLCPDPPAATTTDEGSSAPKNARKGKAKSKPDSTTEDSGAGYTANILMYKYDDALDKCQVITNMVPYDWFSRLDYYVCAATRSNSNSTWLRGVQFESVDANCELFNNVRRADWDYIHTFAGILRWLRESMMKRSSTKLCSIQTVQSEEGISVRLWDEDPREKFLFAVFGEFWDAQVKSLTKGEITWTEGENIEEGWKRYEAQLEIDEMSEIHSKAALKRTRRRSCPPEFGL